MIYAPARERSHSPTGGGRGRGPRHGGYAAFLQNAGLFFRVDSQGLHPRSYTQVIGRGFAKLRTSHGGD